MTTFVGVATAATGNNTSLVPALPAGMVAGDAMLCFASIRNSGTGTPSTPTGWTLLLDLGNARVFGKVHTGSESAPTVAFSGGVANADTLAQIAAWRGVSINPLAAQVQLNTSAQNIAYPAASVTAGARLVLYAGWKQDDYTSVTSPGTEIAEASTTTGDDASQVWAYTIPTAPAVSVSAGSFAVTGGAAAISRGGVLILGAGLTAVEQDIWPPRMLVSATGLGIGDAVTIYRTVGSTRTALRGATEVTADDPALVVVDAELPFGTPIAYTLAVDEVDVASTATAAHTLVGGKVAITDAIEGTAAEVVVTAWPTKRRERQASTYRVGERTVVVSGPLGSATSDIEILTETDTARTNLESLLEDATGGIVQIRQVGGYGGVDAYLATLGVVEARMSQDGTDQRRLITLAVAEVEAWPDTYTARGYTLADIATAYTGLSLADLAGDYSSLLAVAQHDWGL